MWNVPPGFLTQHGYRLMEIFGAYDRALLSHQGLLHAAGCEDTARYRPRRFRPAHVRRAAHWLRGMFPGCKLTVQAQASSDDALFHSLAAGLGKADQELAVAAIKGRIGGQPENLTAVYRSQIAALDRILAECGTATADAAPSARRTSLFDVLRARLAPGRGDHAAELKGPLNTASTLAENLLLEYTEGMENGKVGWGCVDAENLRTLLDLHTDATDFTQRTEPVARMQASTCWKIFGGLWSKLLRGRMSQARPRPKDDVALFLVGHDTNPDQHRRAAEFDLDLRRPPQ